MNAISPPWRRIVIFWIMGPILLMAAPLLAAPGVLQLTVTDQKTGDPVAAQMRLVNQSRRVVRLPNLARDGEWMLVDGEATLRLPIGTYQFEIRRGLEYKRAVGHFVIDSKAEDQHAVALPRFVDMRQEGWYSSDMLTALSQALPLRMRASDLHFAAPIVQDNRGRPDDAAAALQRTRQRLTGAQLTGGHVIGDGAILDRRSTSVSLLFGAGPGRGRARTIELPPSKNALPTAYQWVRDLLHENESEAGDVRETDTELNPEGREGAHDQVEPTTALHTSSASGGMHLFLSRVSHWDLPIWVALAPVHSVGLLHDRVFAGQAEARTADYPHDAVLYPEPEGTARWAQQIYFQLLETGLRIAPTAATGFNSAGQPLGTNRVYVQCENGFSNEEWWDGMRAGRVVVTNGPLLRVRANGEYPGYRFQAPDGETVRLELIVQLSTAQKVQYLEVIQNGRPVQQVRLEDWVAKRGQLPPVVFEESGWFLMRAVVDDPEPQYRAAITGPFYVEIGAEPRISRQACKFFLDWVYQRARRVKLPDPKQKRALLTQHRDARDFWQRRMENATTD